MAGGPVEQDGTATEKILGRSAEKRSGRLQSNALDWTSGEDFTPTNEDEEDSDDVAELIGMKEGTKRKRSMTSGRSSGIPSPPQKRTTPVSSRKPIAGVGGRKLRRSTRGGGRELDLRPVVAPQDEERVNAGPQYGLPGEHRADGATLGETNAIAGTEKDPSMVITAGLQHNEEEARERELVDKAITLMRSEIKCAKCSAQGSMTKNGGVDGQRRAWKCKLCGKQISGQTIPMTLEQQLGQEWRTVVNKVKANREQSIPEKPQQQQQQHQMSAKRSTPGPQAAEMIQIPREEWEQTQNTIQYLVRRQEDLMKQNSTIQVLLKSMTKKLESMENREHPAGRREYTASPDHPPQPSRESPTLEGLAGREYACNQQKQQETERQRNEPIGQRETRQNEIAPRPLTKTALNGNQEETRKLNWAEVTKMNRPALINAVPTQLRNKIEKSKQILIEENFKPLVKPTPTVVYFKNVRRGPVGRIRTALRECLPSWAILGLDFVGASVLEIVMDGKLKHRTVATLRMMGIMEIKDFDILEKNVTIPRTGDSQRDQKKRNLEMAVHRLRKNVDKTRNKWAIEWYKSKLQVAMKKLKEIPESEESLGSTEGRGVKTVQSTGEVEEEDGWKLVGPRSRQTTAQKQVEAPTDLDTVTNIDTAKKAQTSPEKQPPQATGHSKENSDTANKEVADGSSEREDVTMHD